MRFQITFKTLFNDLRNYLALGLEVFGWVLSLPSAICYTISNVLKVE